VICAGTATLYGVSVAIVVGLTRLKLSQLTMSPPRSPLGDKTFGVLVSMTGPVDIASMLTSGIVRNAIVAVHPK